jgi:hypothetical protein
MNAPFLTREDERALAEAGLLVRAWHADREGLFALAHCWKRA